MTIATLSLPVDIPWRRLCVSDDMIDPAICDRKFPYRWRSSLAAFAYEPPADQQTYDGMTVSYLKIACTITSFQPNPDEVGLRDRRVDSYWNTPLLIADYVKQVGQAYACYGAVLEVGVAPSAKVVDGEPVPLARYPFFMDFEPKKREVYELVSDTGENMSRSLDNVNVRKGTTTTGTHEVLDILNGVSASASGLSFGGSLSVQGQWGTRDINQQEYADVRTTDQSREQRENFSHTTQLTQMYQQLNSYHLGTNRAVFFMLPRPHIIDDKETPLTFINGPRRLEGIQEFFLVVLRPKEIAELCVEAYLETAHVGQVPTYGTAFKTNTGTSPMLSLGVTASQTSPKVLRTKTASVTYTAPAGWEIDTAKGGGYVINKFKAQGVTFCAVTTIDKQHLVLRGDVTTGFVVDRDSGQPPEGGGPVNKPVPPGRSPVEGVDGFLDANVTVFLRQAAQVQTGTAAGLYITGRGACCCQDHDPHADPALPAAVGRAPADPHARATRVQAMSESLLFEAPMALALDVAVGGDERMRVADANRVRAEVDRMMVRSVRHPDRYEAGTLSFAESQLISRGLAGAMDTPGHPDDQPLDAIRGLDAEVRSRIAARAPTLHRSDLLLMSPAEQRDRFGLSAAEVRHLRRALVGLEGRPPEPADRWDPPGARAAAREVPNVVGLGADEAEAALAAAGFALGTVAREDSPLPVDTVLSQRPAPASTAVAGTDVALALATGLSVRVPDVVGLPLGRALVLLRDAGFTAEPDLQFVAGESDPPHHVRRVSPAMRSHVTPNATLVLEVAGRPQDARR